MATERSNGIDVMKALAALLIINSHLESFHSRSWMAADGLLGNSIFFFTTGYTLAGSLRRDPSQSLWSFLWKRLSRLYPGVWIVMFLLPPEPTQWSWAEAPGLILYPTLFTFVHVIVPAYPMYYYLLRSRCMSRHLATIAVLLIGSGCVTGWLHTSQADSTSVAWSGLGSVAWTPHFWGTMLLGGWVAQKSRAPGSRPSSGMLILLSVLAYGIYIGLRVMALGAMSARVGHQIQSLAVLAMPMALVVIVTWLSLLEAGGLSRLLRLPWIAGTVAFLAAHSWETYLVHEGIARWHFVSTAVWPLGLVLVFVLTFALAPVLRMITSRSLQASNRLVQPSSRR